MDSKTTKSLNGKRILLTSALPYANGSIHIGHLVEYIQTDIYSRFLKLIGKNAIYCCADDAHGTAIEIKAQKEGITPEALIAMVKKEHEEDFAKYNIVFDNYHSTHSPENQRLAELIYSRLQQKGLIYTKEIDSYYDEQAKRFLPDRFIKGTCPKCAALDQYGDVCEKCNSTHKPTDLVNPYSVISGSTPIRKKTTHYFFKLSAMADKLKEYFANRDFQPEVINYLNNWITEGLQDWDISRDGPYFGFKIPGEEDKYFYVWLDAPIGYLASCANYCQKNGLNEDEYLFSPDTDMIHIIGKDIMYFHYLFWPAMLMAADFNLPQNIHVHGFLTVNGEKMSKSRGTFITAKEMATMYPPECLRYYYAKILSRKLADVDLNFDTFVETVNTEVVANLSNFSYRLLSFTAKNFEGKIVSFNPEKYPVIAEVLAKVPTIKESYSDLHFNKAVSQIMEVSSIGNKFFQENAPWLLMKEGKVTEAQEVCAVACNIARVLSVLISPVLPEFSSKLQTQLNIKQHSWDDISKHIMNCTIGTPEIILHKIEKFQKKSFALDLKVAEILTCKKHPSSEKLLIMSIDVGEADKKRQLVAGLQKYYTPEEMVGKKIILVSNMKPTKLGGELSEGMLLAACNADDTFVKVLEVPNGKPGDSVTAGPMDNDCKEIKYEVFSKVVMKTKSGQVVVETEGNAILSHNGKPVITDAEDGFSIS